MVWNECVVDIETVPVRILGSEEELERVNLSERKPFKSLEDYHKKCSLSSLRGRIVCVSARMVGSGETVSFVGEDEGVILEGFWGFLREHSVDCLVGYNVAGFDLPFVRARTLLHRVRGMHFDRWKGVVDLMLLLSPKWGSWERLDAWCGLFGISGDFGNTGAGVMGQFQRGDWEGIRRHCEDDVDKTWELYDRMRECGLL